MSDHCLLSNSSMSVTSLTWMLYLHVYLVCTNCTYFVLSPYSVLNFIACNWNNFHEALCYDKQFMDIVSWAHSFIQIDVSWFCQFMVDCTRYTGDFSLNNTSKWHVLSWDIWSVVVMKITAFLPKSCLHQSKTKHRTSIDASSRHLRMHFQNKKFNKQVLVRSIRKSSKWFIPQR